MKLPKTSAEMYSRLKNETNDEQDSDDVLQRDYEELMKDMDKATLVGLIGIILMIVWVIYALNNPLC